jgi:hypothetical protein
MQMARGESKVFTFTCVDAAGEPIDLTGASIAFTVTDLAGATVFELTEDGAEVEITDDDGGIFTVEVTSELSDLEPTARWADAVVVTAAGQTLKVAEHEPFYITGS